MLFGFNNSHESWAKNQNSLQVITIHPRSYIIYHIYIHIGYIGYLHNIRPTNPAYLTLIADFCFINQPFIFTFATLILNASGNQGHGQRPANVLQGRSPRRPGATGANRASQKMGKKSGRNSGSGGKMTGIRFKQQRSRVRIIPYMQP